MRSILVTALLVAATALAPAAGAAAERPHWSLELKGGVFFPDTAGWSRYYGGNYFAEYGGALSYQVRRQLEVGVEATYGVSTGHGRQPIHGATAAPTQGSEVTFEHLPLNVFVLGRYLVSEDQWLAPYAGGGYTRMFFNEDVKGQGKVDGSVDGFHVRGGVQFLLDRIDPDGAGNLRQEIGLRHTYFFIEGRYIYAKARTVSSGSVNIGGTSCLGGIRLDF